MAQWRERDGVEIRAYCLMPNHVHLIAVPGCEWVWRSGRREYRWSSAGAHVAGRDDALARVQALVEMVGEGRWEQFLGEQVTREEWEPLGRHERTGRPLGNHSFLGRLEASLGRVLRQLQKRGPKGPWKHRRKNQVWCGPVEKPGPGGSSSGHRPPTA